LKLNDVDFRMRAVPALELTQLFLQDPAGNGIELSFKEARHKP
jgi:glyoxylase I family protein